MLQELSGVQDLPPVHELAKRFGEAIAWADLSMEQPDPGTGLTPRDFFVSLRDRDPHDMEGHWKLIQATAHRQGAPLRRFAFAEPGKILTLWDRAFEDEEARVVVARSQSLAALGKSSESEGARGAILYFEPGLSIYDGASMVASGGYFDVENFPPADTWITYIAVDHSKPYLSGFLLSWVPEELVDLVDRGITVDNSGSIRWAYDEPNPLVQRMCRLLQLTCPVIY